MAAAGLGMQICLLTNACVDILIKTDKMGVGGLPKAASNRYYLSGGFAFQRLLRGT